MELKTVQVNSLEFQVFQKNLWDLKEFLEIQKNSWELKIIQKIMLPNSENSEELKKIKNNSKN